MALQISSYGPKLGEAVGQMLPIAYGVATADGTSLAVTIPQFSKCFGAFVTSSGSVTTVPYVATTSGNSFTATVDSGAVCMYIAFGIPRG